MALVPAVTIHYARYHDGQKYNLDIVREDRSFLRGPARREAWTVYARTEQEAHQTVDYHFGLSALWYALRTPQA